MVFPKYNHYRELDLRDKVDFVLCRSAIYNPEDEAVTLHTIHDGDRPFPMSSRTFLETVTLAVCISEKIRNVEETGAMDSQILELFGQLNSPREQMLLILGDRLEKAFPDGEKMVTGSLSYTDCCDAVSTIIPKCFCPASVDFYCNMAEKLVYQLCVKIVQGEILKSLQIPHIVFFRQ